MGLDPGAPLVAWVEGDRLFLRPRRAVEQELWSLFSSVEGSLADELIAERTEQFRRESRANPSLPERRLALVGAADSAYQNP